MILYYLRGLIFYYKNYLNKILFNRLQPVIVLIYTLIKVYMSRKKKN